MSAGMSDGTTPAPQVRLCRGTNRHGTPCGAAARPASDYCCRHEPSVLAARLAEAPQPAPRQLPGCQVLPGPEALYTAEGLHQLLSEMLVYTLSTPNADLARVHAGNGTAAILLRNLEQRRLEQELAQAEGKCEEMLRKNEELVCELQRLRQQARPPAAPQPSEVVHRNHTAEERLAAAERGCRDLREHLEQREGQLAEVASRLQAAEARWETLLGMEERLCHFCVMRLKTSGILPGSPFDDPDNLGPREILR